MSNIANLFSNFTDLVKPKSVTDSASEYKKPVSNPISLSLNQGNKFNKYQKQIKDKVKNNVKIVSGIEGFQSNTDNQNENVADKIKFNNLQDNKLTNKTVDLLQKNNLSQNREQTIANLRANYASTLTQYEKLLSTISSGRTNYINRVSPNNPYLGKVIQLQDGALFYVTNQGVAKQIPNMEIYNAVSGQNGFPPQGQITQVSISWSNSYSTQGATLPTTPPLIIGTPIQTGQSVGNEGSNVYVNTMISNPSTKYTGCYADNTSSPLMTFIGGSPPPPNTATIVNGNFNEPQIAQNTYNGYWGTNTAVPGWYFNAMLVNSYVNSSYPIPYPNGNQCVSIYYNQYIYQVLNLSTGSYTLSFYLCGSNIGSGGNPINLTIASTGSPGQATQTFSFTPPVDTWTQYTQEFNITVSGPFQITFAGTTSGLYSALTSVSLSSSENTTAGTYTYSMCEQAAINEGYKFFALQNVDQSTSQGYCAVSNDGIASTQKGSAYIASTKISLWSSNTSGQPGSYASFNNGAISIIDPSGASIFSTPNNSTQPSNYIGCYADQSTRAMSNTISSSGELLPATGPYSWSFGVQQCQQAAQQNNMSYFGLQDSNVEGQAQCFTSNDLQQTQQYGVASNCTQFSDGTWQGGAWSNAVYSTSTPNSNFFLILQSNGNMSINLGSSPTDNQGLIWSAGTNGKQQQGNPLMVASSNKFGQNWMPNGSLLYPGEYLSSTNGNLVLMMQADGNLVLYTYQTTTNCQKMADGNMGGGAGANALYTLSQVGVPTNMAQLAYIDQNSELHSYPSTNAAYTNTYTTLTGTDSTGNDISGAAYGNATVEQCQTTCNNNSECAGFSFTNNMCYPKTSSMYPTGEIQTNPNVDLYVRNKMPQTPPMGVTTNTNNIDTVLYQNYINGGEIGESYGIANATSVQKQQLQQLQTKMNLLSNQITNLTNQFENGSQQLEQQSQTNTQSLNKYIKDIKRTNKKIIKFDTNVDNILQDSDIVVLQQNYDYLFWSIIAVTTVIISMNIIKK